VSRLLVRNLIAAALCSGGWQELFWYYIVGGEFSVDAEG
jgi:hypothetical protein